MAEIAGPSLAGVLIQALTAPIAVLVNGIGYIVSAVLLGRIRKREVPAAVEESPSVWRDIALGFSASWDHPLVRPLLLASAAATFFSGTFAALYMKYLLKMLELSVGTVGASSRWAASARSGRARVPAADPPARAGPGPAPVPSWPRSPACSSPPPPGPLWLVLVFLLGNQLIADGFHVAFIVQAVSLRQRVLPLEVLGRSNAAFQAVSGALLPLGALTTGALAELVGVRPALWMGLGVAVTAPLFLLPLWRAKAAPESARWSTTPPGRDRRAAAALHAGGRNLTLLPGFGRAAAAASDGKRCGGRGLRRIDRAGPGLRWRLA